jgi:hypothetical protein
VSASEAAQGSGSGPVAAGHPATVAVPDLDPGQVQAVTSVPKERDQHDDWHCNSGYLKRQVFDHCNFPTR